jgi:hypothetical protein
MSDVYLAFVGLALLGAVGFVAAWFSGPSSTAASSRVEKRDREERP